MARPAAFVIGERVDDPAVRDLTASALIDHALQLFAQTLQSLDLSFNHRQVTAGDAVRLAAVALRLIGEPE